MHDVVTIDDGDEEIKDVSFILLVPLQSSLLLIPICEFFVVVCFPVFVGFFQMSCMHFMLCQIFSSLAEYFQLFLVIAADFLILSHNSCQPLFNEEELLPPWGAVAIESSAY